jgi:hypothetical protein
MLVYLQWALADPQGWVSYDINSPADWAALPSKPIPTGGEALDNTPGWITSLWVPRFSGWQGFDHLCVDGRYVYGWNDDPDDWPESQRFGFVADTVTDTVTFYSNEVWSPRAGLLEAGARYQPFADFPTPADPRHGIWVDDWLWEQHMALVPVVPYG